MPIARKASSALTPLTAAGSPICANRSAEGVGRRHSGLTRHRGSEVQPAGRRSCGLDRPFAIDHRDFAIADLPYVTIRNAAASLRLHSVCNIYCGELRLLEMQPALECELRYLSSRDKNAKINFPELRRNFFKFCNMPWLDDTQ
jgi:hypothetical protein